MKKIFALLTVVMIVSLTQGCTKKEAATDGASADAPAADSAAPPPEQETKKDDSAPAADADTKKE